MKEDTLLGFTNHLASNEPVPGGGGASALAGALGAALGEMITALTIGKKKYSSVEQEMIEIKEEMELLRRHLLELIEEDAKAFQPLSEAYALPKNTENREQILEQNLLSASIVPIEIMQMAVEVEKLLLVLGEKGSRMVVSDAGVGIELCRSAILGASLNVYINTKMMKNREKAEELNQKADELVKKGKELEKQGWNMVINTIR